MSNQSAVQELTLEQLENVAALLGLPILPAAFRPPHYRESLLNLHRLVQRMLDGDEEAARTVAVLKAAFASASLSVRATSLPRSAND